MYIQLEVGWLRHPFPVNSFRIVSEAQLQTVQALGLEAVRIFPDKSMLNSEPPSDAQQAEGAVAQVAQAAETAQAEGAAAQAGQGAEAMQAPPGRGAGDARHWSKRQHQRCDDRFRAAAQRYGQLQACAAAQPEQAMAQSHALVTDYLEDVLPAGDLVIRLLSENSGQGQAEHPVNVSVLSLLLGRALGMTATDLYELGMAALLHDIGKGSAPAAALPRAQYERHVGDSVALASSMGVSGNVLTAMAQHHEFADGTGFPLHLIDEDLSMAGKVLCLVNCYDRLCNPEFAQEGQTPHEALAILYAQFRPRFDASILGAFIRMMGIYPPGSVVQLVDGRFAMVVSVNSSRPLKPQVLVYDALVPMAQAQPLDLEKNPHVVIRRSLRPDQLPRDALSSLSPLHRICYFFERAVDPGTSAVTAL